MPVAGYRHIDRLVAAPNRTEAVDAAGREAIPRGTRLRDRGRLKGPWSDDAGDIETPGTTASASADAIIFMCMERKPPSVAMVLLPNLGLNNSAPIARSQPRA